MERNRDTDETLMRRVAEGDFEAFEVLVNRHSADLYRFVFRVVGQQQEAEDVMQETFLRLWRGAKRYDPRRPFRTWLYTIARRAALNAARSVALRRGADLEAPRSAPEEARSIEQLADSRPTAEEILHSRETQQAVHRAVAELPPRQRLALVLHHYEGMRYHEIAEVMGVSVAAVESLIFRARGNLASVLGDMLGEKG